MSAKPEAARIRQRVDLWLWRARFAKTRAEAARLVSEGGVRLERAGASRQLDKPSVELAPGDALTFFQGPVLRTVRVEALPGRRGPAAEAGRLYRDIPAQE